MAKASDAGHLTDEAYIEMVKSLFSTVVPTIIMGTAFLAVGLRILWLTPELPLLVLLIAGVCAIIARIGVLLSCHKVKDHPDFDAARAGRAERRFAYAYLSFAIVFGLFMAWAFPVSDSDTRLLIVALMFGYGGGVTAGIALRPWICVPSVLLATLPPTFAIVVSDHYQHWGLALLILVFLGGAIDNMLRRFRATAKRFSLEYMLSLVQRRDELTHLPNELALLRRFAEFASITSGTALIAVHVMEFGGFEQVNADFGFPRGDALLKAVAERLERSISPGDCAVRLAGPSFAVVQPVMEHPGHAATMARELHDILSRSYAIADGALTLTLHIGYAVDIQRGAKAEELLGRARGALRRAKAERLAVAQDRRRWGGER